MSACTCPCPTCGTSDLTTLRAEVQAMRDKEDGPHEQCCTRHALDRVLDLIDKHAREGQ